MPISTTSIYVIFLIFNFISTIYLFLIKDLLATKIKPSLLSNKEAHLTT